LVQVVILFIGKIELNPKWYRP